MSVAPAAGEQYDHAMDTFTGQQWSSIRNGMSYQLKVGDVVIIPARTPARVRMKAEGRKFPGRRKLGAKVVKGGKQTFVVQLPRQYRHMSVDQFIEASKQALREMKERFERTGRLIG
jgi:hypothetical protein